MKATNFDKFPKINIDNHQCVKSWDDIAVVLKSEGQASKATRKVLVVDCYQGVYHKQILRELDKRLNPVQSYDTCSVMYPEEKINDQVDPYVTDDPVFGFMTPLSLSDFFDPAKVLAMRKEIEQINSGLIVVVGTGASLIIPSADVLVYADMPRWEIQTRFRTNKISNLGTDNKEAQFSYQYKRSFFVDWRVCDRHKKHLMDEWDFVIDTTSEQPKMISGTALSEAFKTASKRPFRVVPFFDPGPWGGQWLKEVCDLDRNVQNFAWAFDCVPEENSLLLEFDGDTFEIPSINLVFAQPEAVLGKKVFEHFGYEFPIRFDILDTMQGGNLSLQVHPDLNYIRENFGMKYTQEESYYFLEAKDDAIMYLGLKEDVNKDAMLQQLQEAQENCGNFNADAFVEKWPVKKHDHVLIPSGTIHCSGANSVVLEISATPFIFTFKLWDWGRMGLDGKPRPISLEHGKQVIRWERTTDWTKENLIDQVELVDKGNGWKEEKTGLYKGSFIETNRYWFDKKVLLRTDGVVNVLNLVEGREAIVESPKEAFEPFVVHYAETFIVPAEIGEYTVRPFGSSEGQKCAIVKASVQTENLVNYK